MHVLFTILKQLLFALKELKLFGSKKGISTLQLDHDHNMFYFIMIDVHFIKLEDQNVNKNFKIGQGKYKH